MSTFSSIGRIMAIAVVFTVGCASTDLKTTEVETFVPNITPNGTKVFTYTLEDHSRPKTRTHIQFQDHRLQDAQDPGGTTVDPRAQARILAERRFYRLLETKLERSGFCREGYIELQSDIGIDKSMLRGECREEATEEDLERFDRDRPSK